MSSVRCVSASGSSVGLQFPHFSHRMFMWVGSKAADGKNNRRFIYNTIHEHDILDQRKTVTALKAGEDRAIVLGLSMVLFSIMMYFVLGITVLRSYAESVWTDEVSCTIVNATVMWDVNCLYTCGAECQRSSRYPCLQVYVSLNSSGKVVRLLHNEAQDNNPECFYIPKCRKDYVATQTIIQNISEHLKSQHTLQCFLDPTEKVDYVILTQIYGRAVVFNSLFWPTFTFMGGIILIAMVKLTQYLSFMYERISHIKR
ncbi:calcium-activated potassium channel subunit beta-2-like [Betta splendens]|uniref:Calcium-activated potassium channel subunit beta-2-like n=1 Tax=Betta splendens TaxID=158456 RepID=A0A6P7M4R1_BETSP|nr:calcium-activated potassium channel subunit beta-2-like [Betta splendens]